MRMTSLASRLEHARPRDASFLPSSHRCRAYKLGRQPDPSAYLRNLLQAHQVSPDGAERGGRQACARGSPQLSSSIRAAVIDMTAF
jgi:hypothetical protein